MSRWADGADSVIGGSIPKPDDCDDNEPCESCMGRGEGEEEVQGPVGEAAAV